MLFLDRSQVEDLLDLGALIDALAPAMVDLSASRASVPRRNFATAGEAGLLAAMPAYLPTQGILAAKLVLVFPGNASKGLETHQAVVAVFDPETGVPVALMDGASITALRTAAGSALATRLCARPDATVLTIVGTGVQARAHARALPRVRDITRMLVVGRTREKSADFAAEIGATVGTIATIVTVAESPTEAIRAADIVCCCTSARAPVLRREWLRPGTHVNSVGFTRGLELDPSVFAGAQVVVESRAAAIGEFPHGADDLTAAIHGGLLDASEIHEVGELVSGVRTGRTTNDQITVYRSVGVAAQDAVAAGLVLHEARARGIGTEVSL